MHKRLLVSFFILVAGITQLEASQSSGNQPRVSACTKICATLANKIKSMFWGLTSRCRDTRDYVAQTAVGRMVGDAYNEKIARPASWVWGQVARNGVDVRLRRLFVIASPLIMPFVGGFSALFLIGWDRRYEIVGIKLDLVCLILILSGAPYLILFFDHMPAKTYLKKTVHDAQRMNLVFMSASFGLAGLCLLRNLIANPKFVNYWYAAAGECSYLGLYLLISTIGLECMTDDLRHAVKAIIRDPRLWRRELARLKQEIAAMGNTLIDHFDRHAAPEERMYKNKTQLHIAASRKRIGLANTLLLMGANPNRQDDDGQTALHYAVRNRNAETTFQLMVAGANAEIRDSKAKSAKDLIAQVYVLGGTQAKQFIKELEHLYAIYKQESLEKCGNIKDYLKINDICRLVADYAYGVPNILEANNINKTSRGSYA